ncbi:Sodium/calcium exchanger protein-domain-containing protein [Absidia repens]|uniref:Sodium/calcium exchanger protein-domain-containing protein n=1 Tax=Absidia repens TaxID=90262 RepID=A0A1X2I189_9FUNG|nr:Sodium/calcium exchanger protein-domain-containing protein [Absidia repens]
MTSTKSIVYGGFFIIVLIITKILTSDVHSLSLTTMTTKSHCSHLELQDDQCAFVKSHCHGFSAIYLEFYYCSSLWKPMAMGVLLSGLFLLFGAISVVASDFFCPNLQTIASKLELSESLAGVTVLAFGNGSPDLFGTFSAMDTGSGSMAIGEIIGAAFFIVSVITGCMGIIRPFQSKRITFMRDASFLTGAVALLTWIVYHGKIYWYHGLALICYYITYVVTVLLSSYQWQQGVQLHQEEEKDNQGMVITQNLLDETSRLLGSQGKPPRLEIPDQGFSADQQPHLGHILRPTSAYSSNPSISQHQMPRTTSTNGSISTLRPFRRAMTPRVGIRTSFFGAIEFTSQVSAIRRASSTQQMIATQASSLLVPDDQQQKRKRQVSVPQGFWQRTSNLSISSSIPNRRPRASTITTAPLQPPRLFPPPPATANASTSAARPMSPESTNSSMGMAEDYFAYLSTHQPQPMPHPPHLVIPASSPPAPAVNTAPEIRIPEIRLAPPVIDDSSTNTSNANNNRLHVITPSPSMTSNCSDNDCFVSARQSPEITPTTVDHPPLPAVIPPLEEDDDDDEQKPPVMTIPWYDTAVQVSQVLFPTLQEWSYKSWLSCVSSLVAMPLVLVFTLTLPVAEADDVKIDQVEVIPDDDDDYVYHSTSAGGSPSDFHVSYYNNRPGCSYASTTTSPTTPAGYAQPTQQQQQQQQTSQLLLPVPAGASSYLAVPSSASETFHRSPSMHTTMEPTDDDALLQNHGWCRWLVAVQAVISTMFFFGILIFNGFLDSSFLWVGMCIGGVLSVTVMTTTDATHAPSWCWMLAFVGFVISLNWIFLLANAMVGLLQALGKIFDVSEAIMGLTVFAFGNSVGDLVSNTAIAKMGFPTMAISACYAGPLLNMVLGVGVSSTYQIWKSHGHPYPLVIPPTILVSAGGLLTVLLSTLFVVNMNGFHVNKQLGYWTISVYVFCCVTNLLLEFTGFEP